MEVLEGIIDPLDLLPLGGGKDDREDRLEDEKEKAIERAGENAEENPPDQTDPEGLHVAEEAAEDGAAVLGDLVRGRGGEVEGTGPWG
jgi:hypothetical protein